jgi:uncharacterized damage-inducible protein DinB
MSYTLPQPEQPGQSVLAAMFEYNAWANGKLLDFCTGLSDEQLRASTVGGYGSIYATLGHLVHGEVSYVSRVNGKLPANPPPTDRFAGFDELRDAVRWANAELLQLALVARSDTLVVEEEPEGTVRYKLADLMVQASTHAMEHRTHVAAIITALGLEPPDTSTWAWMDELGTCEVIARAQS